MQAEEGGALLLLLELRAAPCSRSCSGMELHSAFKNTTGPLQLERQHTAAARQSVKTARSTAGRPYT
ncbi:hypothetical protein EYF80_052190 [Liparis tanakae]|uniref:Uncharacterized protein n=1 Tax=Liparis tanakae TaxID=230148 RepID=A0A4Z2FA47_9TELE|nr:hypothetical protein EYF80_052190 [Liparis tanakae]